MRISRISRPWALMASSVPPLLPPQLSLHLVVCAALPRKRCYHMDEHTTVAL